MTSDGDQRHPHRCHQQRKDKPSSIFPVASLRIGYGALVEAMSRMLADRSPEDRDRFFWKMRRRFTGCRGRPRIGTSLPLVARLSPSHRNQRGNLRAFRSL
jgi:hypothetical protein